MSGPSSKPDRDRIRQRAAESRRALKAENEALRKALGASEGYLLNAKIDLESGAPKRTAIASIEGGLRVVRAALAATNTNGDAS